MISGILCLQPLGVEHPSAQIASRSLSSTGLSSALVFDLSLILVRYGSSSVLSCRVILDLAAFLPKWVLVFFFDGIIAVDKGQWGGGKLFEL